MSTELECLSAGIGLERCVVNDLGDATKLEKDGAAIHALVDSTCATNDDGIISLHKSVKP